MLQTAFDNYSGHYDADFTNSATGMAQRKMVWRRLKKFIKKEDAVLEINCGTGTDAIYLSDLSASVDACDISEKMIAVCKQKAAKAGQDNIRFFVKDIRSISELKGNYDFIFSNFSGLNCLDEDELKKFANDIAQRLRPGGRLFLVFFGTDCVWEKFYFSLRRDPRKNRRKSKEGLVTEMEAQTFRTYYYSAAQLRKIFSGFQQLEAKPIGLFLPPGFLEKWFRHRGIILTALSTLERFFAWLPFTANQGDHLLIVFRKD